MWLGANQLGIPMHVISNQLRLVAGILVCFAVNKKGYYKNGGLINIQSFRKTWNHPPKKQLFTFVFNWAFMLVVQYPNSHVPFANILDRSQGYHPECQCDCKPGQLLAYSHKIIWWVRETVKIIWLYKIQFYLADNIPFKWVAFMQIDMGSNFETLK